MADCNRARLESTGALDTGREPSSSSSFLWRQHLPYLTSALSTLPKPYVHADTSRITLAYFAATALYLIKQPQTLDKTKIINWVYAMQLKPTRDQNVPPERLAGFRAGPFMGNKFSHDGTSSSSQFDTAHLAMTYAALAILTLLGDDLKGVDRDRTLAFVRSMQNDDGSFRAYSGGESDMRFLYCAAAICALLGDDEFVGIDVRRATDYVLSCRGYDGGVGLDVGQESHGGATYTALAALSIMETLHELPHPERCIRWCVERQVRGFQGRPNKDEDTCYSFWIGASLDLLGAPSVTNAVEVHKFVRACEGSHGGFAKLIGSYPDLLHTFYALCGMSLVEVEGLESLDSRLGIIA